MRNKEFNLSEFLSNELDRDLAKLTDLIDLFGGHLKAIELTKKWFERGDVPKNLHKEFTAMFIIACDVGNSLALAQKSENMNLSAMATSVNPGAVLFAQFVNRVFSFSVFDTNTCRKTIEKYMDTLKSLDDHNGWCKKHGIMDKDDEGVGMKVGSIDDLPDEVRKALRRAIG